MPNLMVILNEPCGREIQKLIISIANYEPRSHYCKLVSVSWFIGVGYPKNAPRLPKAPIPEAITDRIEIHTTTRFMAATLRTLPRP